MDRQQKLLNILLGLLITDVEDCAVLPEHREDISIDRNPNNYSFKELLVERFRAEAENCNIKVKLSDLSYFIEEVYRVADTVRT